MASSGIAGDLRFALRGLARNRAFTAATVLTLALGIGATTAVFTLVDSVLIRPLPFRAADRLVALRHSGRDGQDALPMSQGLYVLYRQRVKALASLALYSSSNVNLVVGGRPERIASQIVTPGYFSTLGVEPVKGRAFTEVEGAPGGEPVVILSNGFWRSAFGADPDVLGKTVDINGRLRSVVGVMPADFGFPIARRRSGCPSSSTPHRRRSRRSAPAPSVFSSRALPSSRCTRSCRALLAGWPSCFRKVARPRFSRK